MNALEFVLGQPWAMLPEMIETLISIADRSNATPEAVAAKLGRPLENTRSVDIYDGGIALIPVRGPISRYASMFSEISGATSLSQLATDFRTALDDPEVKGIVLEIDSPGGQAAGIGEFAAQVRAGSKIKPVTAYVSSMGASAALWIASAAGKVVLSPSGLMGSMGVVWPVARTTDKDRKQTIEFVSSQSPNKRPDLETDAGRAQMQTVVDAMAETFVEAVASYRGMEPGECIERFGHGGIRVGKAAVVAGMADKLGSLESCLTSLATKARKSGQSTTTISYTSGVKEMKMNIPAMITAWLSKGSPEIMDVAEVAGSTVEPEPAEKSEGGIVKMEELVTELKVDSGFMEAQFAEARAKFEAEMRAGRVELYRNQAEAWLMLHSDRITPAEKDNFKSAFVAASLIDAENPVAGYSCVDGLKAQISARKPHQATAEFIPGDASQVAAKLAQSGLKVVDNTRDTAEEGRSAESSARIAAMLNATEIGRAAMKK